MSERAWQRFGLISPGMMATAPAYSGPGTVDQGEIGSGAGNAAETVGDHLFCSSEVNRKMTEQWPASTPSGDRILKSKAVDGIIWDEPGPSIMIESKYLSS